MSLDKQQIHRPGNFKQVNKAHKHGRHRSKGSISESSKGKVSVKILSRKNKAELNREQRRHQAVQLRKNKRDETLAKKRCLGGSENAPFLVCILPLQKQIDPMTALSILKQCDPEAVVNQSPMGVTHVSIPRFKQRYSFVIPALDNELAILDALKMSDTVLFLISAGGSPDFEEEIMDKWGSNILQTGFAQGMPTPIVALTDLESVHPKKRNEQKQAIQKFVNKYLPDEKVMPLDKFPDAINIIRKIGSQKQRSVHYRDRRPHMYAEHVEYIPNPEGDNGTLKLTGYLRGKHLNVNSLIHIPGLGDYQMSQIDAPYDPYPLDLNKTNKQSIVMEGDKIAVRVLARCDPEQQESLESENIPDPMDQEQTWPTEEEIKMAQEEQKPIKAPKGWSDYQASWIPDDGEDFSGDEEDDMDEDRQDYMDAKSDEESVKSDGEESCFEDAAESEIGANDQKYDEELDLNAEQAELRKIKAAKVDFEFPDEIDTPQDIPASERFRKYRALESFRTSPWDPLENLPPDYGRIFQLESFNVARHKAWKSAEDTDPSAQPGWYITVHVKNVPKDLWNRFNSAKPPVTFIGMLKTEHKMSIMHTVLKRTNNFEEPIKSKEPLIFQVGYRRFKVNPIFSEHTNGQKHKFERYFQAKSISVATFYAPIQYPPGPVLCYKEVNNRLVLVATGSLLSCTPTRLIVKRVVLSGHPFKVHKRTAVIRFMFFNREDIEYFKVCMLRTKYGRQGKIKEPLGTHGHMKCVFNKPIKSQDTVMLYLYKRVFPTWTYEDLIVSCPEESMES